MDVSRIIESLNDAQREAVCAETEPLLVLAKQCPYVVQIRRRVGSLDAQIESTRVGRRRLERLAEDGEALLAGQVVWLAGDPAHADTVALLRERLLRWMLDTGDVLPPVRDPRGWRPCGDRWRRGPGSRPRRRCR